MTTPSTPLHRAAAFEKALELTREVLRELGFAEAAQTAQAESHLERDLGLHSLERLELIERVGAACAAALPETLAADAETIADLAEAVLAAQAGGRFAAHAPSEAVVRPKVQPPPLAPPPQIGPVRRALEFLYGIWGYIAFTVFLLPTWLLAKFAPSRASATRITQVGSRIFFRLAGIRIGVQGGEHLKNHVPCVFVSNHTSFIDVVLYLAMLKCVYRFVSKVEVASWPFIGTFLNRREDFRFKREDKHARLDQARQLENALRQGESLLIFPEGTFVAREGLRRFQLGAFRAAVLTGRPVVPIALRGVRQIFRDETVILRPGRIRITVGEPIFARTEPGHSTWSEIIRLRNATRDFIGRHCGEPVE